ncbi:MAG TPA: VOC family protein [Longimicrobiales bacterium]|nr:VOC family protein [Longimicrobiales bacterium]
MGTTTRDISGPGGPRRETPDSGNRAGAAGAPAGPGDPAGAPPGPGEPAAPGTYGEAPAGYRLPTGAAPGAVTLQVADLARSLAWYTEVLGLRTIDHGAGRAVLAAADDTLLVELRERRGVRSVAGRARLGLYHFAILLPDRASLGRFVVHLSDLGVRAGAGDHLVSEAFYLSDPDGLGIEVYADRPRDAWRRSGRELMMATDPVDVPGVVQAAGGAPWTGMPAGTTIGHVHLHVGDLARATEFYHRGLGLDRMVWSYPGALFLAAGGYHHHLGLNTWAAGAPPAGEEDARLLEWTLVVPAAADVAEVAESLEAAGYPVERIGGDVVTQDPWHTRLRVMPQQPPATTS